VCSAAATALQMTMANPEKREMVLRIPLLPCWDESDDGVPPVLEIHVLFYSAFHFLFLSAVEVDHPSLYGKSSITEIDSRMKI
jgi:hypothetical protein